MTRILSPLDFQLHGVPCLALIISVQTHLPVWWHLGYPAMQVMGLIRILNGVCLLVSPQQFRRASWGLQASIKLLQYDITHLATPATHAWADAGAGAQGTAAEAAGSPVHATESACESDTSHKRQRAHHPSLCHPGADGSPQGMWVLPLCLDWACPFSSPMCHIRWTVTLLVLVLDSYL